MKPKREFEKTNLFEELKKKVKLCDDSRSSTVINENSNSMDSLINLSIAASKVLSKPSLRERFESIHTLESIKESQYYGLIDILYLIDQQLNFLKQRRESLFWPNIVKCCYESSQKTISLRQLQEILTVWTESYQVSWEKFEKNQGSIELLIKLPNKQLLNSTELIQRKNEFQEKLQAYLFLNGNFIEPKTLPNKPIVQDNTIKNELTLVNKIETIKPSLAPKINIQKIFQNVEQSKQPLSKVSQLLIEKIKERKQLEKQKEEEKNNEKQLSSKKQLTLVASMIHQYYFQRDVSNMFLNNVVKYIFDHNTSILMSIEQIKSIISTLINQIQNWISIIENPSGQLLRLNKELDLPSIINQLS